MSSNFGAGMKSGVEEEEERPGPMGAKEIELGGCARGPNGAQGCEPVKEEEGGGLETAGPPLGVVAAGIMARGG